MTEPIKRLLAKEVTLDRKTTHVYPKGYSHTVLTDPKTGKQYEPNEGWEVTGENLEELFHERVEL